MRKKSIEIIVKKTITSNSPKMGPKQVFIVRGSLRV